MELLNCSATRLSGFGDRASAAGCVALSGEGNFTTLERYSDVLTTYVAWASSPLLLAVSAIVAVELLFYLLVQRQRRGWSSPLVFDRGHFKPQTLTPSELLKKFEDYMTKSKRHAESLLEGWFFDAPIETLGRHDVEEFVAWAVYMRRRDELTEEELDVVLSFLERVEAKVGVLPLMAQANGEKTPAGKRSSLRFAAHTWEENVSHRHLPVFIYAAMGVLRTAVDWVVLRLLGFQRMHWGHLSYWIRYPRSAKVPKPQEDAFLFLHGILVARIFYLLFVWRFSSETLILVDMPWVAIDPWKPSTVSSEDFVESVEGILRRHSISRACVAAHSYGSLATAWLLRDQRTRERISRVILIAGVALSIFIPKLCRIVLYQQPFWMEHSLARVFWREFFWYQGLLTAEDLPKGSLVILSERDELMPVPEVEEDCQDHGVDVLVLKNLGHGFELFNPLACGKIVEFIRARRTSGCTACEASNPTLSPQGLQATKPLLGPASTCCGLQ